MKNYKYLLLLCFLFVSLNSFGQDAALKNWPAFWAKFKTAIHTKNTSSLRKLMSNDFFDGGGGGTASQWVSTMQTNNSWTFYKPIVAKGTKPGKCSVPCRSTKDGYLLFEYRKGKWYWVGLGGEGQD
ncbi:hypothetical protein D3C85_1262610 [compost metagenome]